MRPTSLLDDEPREVVLDTSTVINLNATGYAERILGALPHRFLIPLPVVTELERGQAKGYNDAADMFRLMNVGVIQTVRMTDVERSAFIKFVGGPAAQSLGDGEAATLALAQDGHRWACIDEKKGRHIFSQLPKSRLVSTLDIMLHNSVAKCLAKSELEIAVVAALEEAYMNVQAEHLDWVLATVPRERLNRCLSLPKRYRT